MSDPPALGHIRDHSNYLTPRGKRSLLEDLAIVVRGLVTNIILSFRLSCWLLPSPSTSIQRGNR